MSPTRWVSATAAATSASPTRPPARALPARALPGTEQSRLTARGRPPGIPPGGRPVSASTHLANLRTTMTSQPWPATLPVRSVRVARPTDQLDEVVRFYTDGLGLSELGRFEGHAGYRGVLLGLPGLEYHLEFTQHDEGSPGP